MKAVPQLMFQGGVLTDVLNHWQRAFPAMEITVLAGDNTRPSHVKALIAGQELMLFDSTVAHDFGFTPAISLVITAERGEIDQIAAVLLEGGKVLMPLGEYDFSPYFGWLEDCFGVSWQVMVTP